MHVWVLTLKALLPKYMKNRVKFYYLCQGREYITVITIKFVKGFSLNSSHFYLNVSLLLESLTSIFLSIFFPNSGLLLFLFMLLTSPGACFNISPIGTIQPFLDFNSPLDPLLPSIKPQVAKSSNCLECKVEK